MTNELVYVRRDLDEMKREIILIKNILLSLQMRKEETFDEEIESWNLASDEVWMNIDNE